MTQILLPLALPVKQYQYSLTDSGLDLALSTPSSPPLSISTSRSFHTTNVTSSKLLEALFGYLFSSLRALETKLARTSLDFLAPPLLLLCCSVVLLVVHGDWYGFDVCRFGGCGFSGYSRYRKKMGVVAVSGVRGVFAISSAIWGWVWGRY